LKQLTKLFSVFQLLTHLTLRLNLFSVRGSNKFIVSNFFRCRFAFSLNNSIISLQPGQKVFYFVLVRQNSSNNSLNFCVSRFVCPNCHLLTDIFCSECLNLQTWFWCQIEPCSTFDQLKTQSFLRTSIFYLSFLRR
jgi:hypothetical protein